MNDVDVTGATPSWVAAYFLIGSAVAGIALGSRKMPMTSAQSALFALMVLSFWPWVLLWMLIKDEKREF